MVRAVGPQPEPPMLRESTELTTLNAKDGAKPGTYKVMISKMETSGLGATMSQEEQTKYLEQHGSPPPTETKNVLPPQYAEVTTTPLTATVKDGDKNELISTCRARRVMPRGSGRCRGNGWQCGAAVGRNASASVMTRAKQSGSARSWAPTEHRSEEARLFQKAGLLRDQAGIRAAATIPSIASGLRPRPAGSRRCVRGRTPSRQPGWLPPCGPPRDGRPPGPTAPGS